MSKLVAYFSASGVTAGKAQQLAKVVGADLHEIAPAVKYTSADLNWMDKHARSTVEANDDASRPELAEPTTDLSAYDTVYIGFPIWWYTAPKIIRTFIENNDLKGKKIALFATSGGSNLKKALKEFKKDYPDLDFVGGEMLNGPVTKDIL